MKDKRVNECMKNDFKRYWAGQLDKVKGPTCRSVEIDRAISLLSHIARRNVRYNM